MKYNSLELKAARARRGMTQADVARKMGVSVTAYTLKENGKRIFTLPNIQKLAQFLNLEPVEIQKIFFAN